MRLRSDSRESSVSPRGGPSSPLHRLRQDALQSGEDSWPEMQHHLSRRRASLGSASSASGSSPRAAGGLPLLRGHSARWSDSGTSLTPNPGAFPTEPEPLVLGAPATAAAAAQASQGSLSTTASMSVPAGPSVPAVSGPVHVRPVEVAPAASAAPSAPATPTERRT